MQLLLEKQCSISKTGVGRKGWLAAGFDKFQGDACLSMTYKLEWDIVQTGKPKARKPGDSLACKNGSIISLPDLMSTVSQMGTNEAVLSLIHTKNLEDQRLGTISYLVLRYLT